MQFLCTQSLWASLRQSQVSGPVSSDTIHDLGYMGRTLPVQRPLKLAAVWGNVR